MVAVKSIKIYTDICPILTSCDAFYTGSAYGYLTYLDNFAKHFRVRNVLEFKLAQPENVHRIGILANLPNLLQSFGTDLAQVLSNAGLSEHALDDPESTIPFAAMGRLVAIAAERTRCPHLGLLLGKQIGIASLGVVGEAMRHAPTLGAALQEFSAQHHRNTHGAVAYLLRHGDQTLFGYAVYHPRMSATPHVYDGAAAAIFNIVRELVGPHQELGMEVLLSRAEPQDPEPYRSHFHATLRFDADQTGVLLPSEWLDRPVAGANADRRKMLEMRVAAFRRAGDLDIVTRLRRALRVGLFNGQVAGDEIASGMEMHRRTLHRRLADAGVTFQEVLDETRCELAQQLLANTRLSIGDIGAVLRYSDPSIFTRAFTRWTGQAPKEWRAAL